MFMMHYTKYAEEKFEILNKYGVYLTREQVEEAVKAPDKAARKGGYHTAKKDGVKVVLAKNGEVMRVITFYPVK